MNIIATVALLQLCLSATVSDNISIETTLTAELGDPFILPCYSVGNSTPSSTKWTKDGKEIGNGGGSTPFPATVLQNGSLRIEKVVAAHEGIYLCSSTRPDKSTVQARALLRVTSGPDNLSTLIFPVVTLSNGTFITSLGTFVHFYCSSSSSQSQWLSWTFSGAPSSTTTLNSTSQTTLDYWIKSIQPSDQGVYTCSAINTVSNRTVSKSSELLVYYMPETHPDCMPVKTQDPSYIQLNCSWPGTYPSPKLRWGDNGDFQETDNLSVTLNSSEVSDGRKITCTAQHALLHEGSERSCSITLKAPYPVGDPMVTALEGSSVTLTCMEATAIPEATTTWRKGMQQTLITSGSKYLLSGNDPVYKLAIFNISTDDEDFYFCRSENQLSIVELEVHLIVKKSSSAYTGAIIGVFISALIIGSAVVITRILYSKRHKICLGYSGGEDRGDVLSLVDSDDEQVFQDTVPQLPPLANGHHTTLVEIHRIPSTDHDEVEIADVKPQQPEETDQTEQSENLVTL